MALSNKASTATAVLANAASETVRPYQGSVRSAVFAAIKYLISLGVQYALMVVVGLGPEGRDIMMDAAQIVAFVAFPAILFFLFNLWLAPYRLAKLESQALARRVSKIEGDMPLHSETLSAFGKEIQEKSDTTIQQVEEFNNRLRRDVQKAYKQEFYDYVERKFSNFEAETHGSIDLIRASMQDLDVASMRHELEQILDKKLEARFDRFG